mgnify:CR=1 FL=1
MNRISEKTIHVAVEGMTDEAVARKILQTVGIKADPIVHIKRGKMNLKQKIKAYNNAALFERWFVLIDLDTPEKCAPATVKEWLPEPNPGMCFRIAVPQIESWLLADRIGLAKYLSVSQDKIPNDPDSVQNAKDIMIKLAYQSKKRDIRNDMVHISHTHSLKNGPAYTSRLREFALHYWNVTNASSHSKSLDKCLKALHRLLKG